MLQSGPNPDAARLIAGRVQWEERGRLEVVRQGAEDVLRGSRHVRRDVHDKQHVPVHEQLGTAYDVGLVRQVGEDGPRRGVAVAMVPPPPPPWVG